MLTIPQRLKGRRCLENVSFSRVGFSDAEGIMGCDVCQGFSFLVSMDPGSIPSRMSGSRIHMGPILTVLHYV